MSVAENVSRLRVEKAMTQQELADKIGVSRQMIGQIERGSKLPTIVLGRDIAVALGVGVEDLLR